MLSRRSILVCLVPLSLAASGCALLKGAFQTPTLTFVRGSVRDVTLKGATLDLVFRADNPNAFGLELASVSYALDVEGKRLVAGSPPAGLQLVAKGSTELTFPAQVEYLQLAEGLQAAFAKTEAKYKASGEIGVKSPIGVVKLPLSAEGTFPIPRLPRVSIGTPRIERMNPLSGARVVVPVELTNDNAFPLPVGGVSAKVKLAGVEVGRAEVGGGDSVPANQKKSWDVGMDLSFLSAGQAVVQLLTSGEGRVAVEGTASIGGLEVPIAIDQVVKLSK